MRELENILERGLSLAADPQHISADDLHLTPVADESESPMPPGEKWPLQDYLDRVERAAINEALEKTRYNRTAAAKLLGHHVSRDALPDGAVGHQVAVSPISAPVASQPFPKVLFCFLCSVAQDRHYYQRKLPGGTMKTIIVSAALAAFACCSSTVSLADPIPLTIDPTSDGSLYTCAGCNVVSEGAYVLVSGYIQGAVKFSSDSIVGTVTRAFLTLNPYGLPLFGPVVEVYGYGTAIGQLDETDANAGTFLGLLLLPRISASAKTWFLT